MSKIANHPNPDLHKKLLDAAKAKKLDAQFIQHCCSAQFPPKVEGNVSAYINWNTTLSLLGHAPAKIWFAGVSKPGMWPCTQWKYVLKSDNIFRHQQWWHLPEKYLGPSSIKSLTNTWYVLAQDVLHDDLSIGVYYWY